MLGLCCDETYGAMINYDVRDDYGDNDGNEDKIDDDNAASGSGSNGPNFDLIMTTHSHGGGLGDDGNGSAAAAHYLYTHHIKYVP